MYLFYPSKVPSVALLYQTRKVPSFSLIFNRIKSTFPLFTYLILNKLPLFNVSECFLFLNLGIPIHFFLLHPVHRQLGHCGQEAETHPGVDMDTHSALLHLHAHVGGRRAHSIGGRPHTKAAAAELDPKQGARPPH